MIDFFDKTASMTKKVTGIARLKGIPHVNARPKAKVKMVGTFYDEEDAVTSVLLEVADDAKSRKLGLMGRDKLPEICGMLFKGLSGGGYFWMKNCLIPLDVAFMTEDGIITKTYSMPVDEDGENHYEYGKDDTMAVEVAMGFFEKAGRRVGQWLIPFLRPQPTSCRRLASRAPP